MKNDNSIIEGNKLIAEFMGGVPCKITVKSIGEVDGAAFDYGAIPMDELPYHNDWNLLMPVVEKIHKICDEKGYPLSNNSREQDNLKQPHVDNPLHWKSWSYHRVHLYTDIDRVWKEVIQFIQWYNQTKIKTNEQ